MCSVSYAQAVTAAAFAKGRVPAPFYLYVLARANRQALAYSKAIAPGCAGPATAGGTVYVQRHTAGHKVAPGAPGARKPQHAAPTPTATRRVWGTLLVPAKHQPKRIPGVPAAHQPKRWCSVQTLRTVTVVP